MSQLPTLVLPEEIGELGVPYLKHCWAKVIARRNGAFMEASRKEWHFDNLLLNGLGLSLEETL